MQRYILSGVNDGDIRLAGAKSLLQKPAKINPADTKNKISLL
jgi:hypothetical protein